jgi:hypothetical protein
MSLRFDPLTGWVFDTPNRSRPLRDPHGPPSARQLLVLARAGLLELRAEPGEPITKLGAAKAIDCAGIASRSTRRTDDEIAAKILAVVAEHPGANWVEVRSRVCGAGLTLAWIRKQLVLDRRLVVRRDGQRMRLYLPGATTELGA